MEELGGLLVTRVMSGWNGPCELGGLSSSRVTRELSAWSVSLESVE